MLVVRALALDPDLIQMVICGAEQLATPNSTAPYTATAAALQFLGFLKTSLGNSHFIANATFSLTCSKTMGCFPF